MWARNLAEHHKPEFNPRADITLSVSFLLFSLSFSRSFALCTVVPRPLFASKHPPSISSAICLFSKRQNVRITPDLDSLNWKIQLLIQFFCLIHKFWKFTQCERCQWIFHGYYYDTYLRDNLVSFTVCTSCYATPLHNEPSKFIFPLMLDVISICRLHRETHTRTRAYAHVYTCMKCQQCDSHIHLQVNALD